MAAPGFAGPPTTTFVRPDAKGGGKSKSDVPPMSERKWLEPDPAYIAHCQNGTEHAGVICEMLIHGDECTQGSQCPYYHHNKQGQGKKGICGKYMYGYCSCQSTPDQCTFTHIALGVDGWRNNKHQRFGSRESSPTPSGGGKGGKDKGKGKPKGQAKADDH